MSLEKEKWDCYWKSKSIKKRIIETVRILYFAKYFAKYISKYVKKGPILEAGCGSASISKVLTNKGFITIGIDNSLEALQIAKINCTYVVIADINHLPFKANSFEVVFNQGVMEHFNEEEFTYIADEIKSVTKQFIIIMPCNTSVFKWVYNPFDDVHNQDVFWPKNRLFAYLTKSFPLVKVKYLLGSFFLSMIGFAKK